MGFLWVCVFHFVGVISVSFILLQVLLLLSCTYPALSRLKKHGYVVLPNAYIKCSTFAFFYFAIYVIILICIAKFANHYMKIGFAIGTVCSVIPSIKKLGFNLDNMSDFVHANKNLVDLYGLVDYHEEFGLTEEQASYLVLNAINNESENKEKDNASNNDVA